MVLCRCLRPADTGTSTFLIIIIFSINTIYAQKPVEILVGHKQIQHEFFFFKDIDSSGKSNLFSTARFAVDYKDSDLNISAISSHLTYNFNESWGLSLGGFYAEGDFAPLIAISYTYANDKGDLLNNLFPTALYNLNTEQMGYEMFGLVFYTPKINDKQSFFSQTILGTTFNDDFSQHLTSYQQIRPGFGFKDWFQIGLGIDQNFFGTEFQYSNNIGNFYESSYRRFCCSSKL